MTHPDLYDPDNASDETLALGKLGALLDGNAEAFNFRGFDVRREGEWIVVAEPYSGQQLGGKVHMKGATLLEVFEWLENKVEYWGKTL